MTLNTKEIYDLNNSNVASQNIQLGTYLDNLGTAYTKISGSTYSARFGDDTGYTTFESDGTMVLSGCATVWDDIFFPLITAKQGQTDKPAFSASEIAYLFPQADTSALMYIVAQFPHTRKQNSNINPHVHWKQTQSGSVIFKMDYKWFPIGGSIPADFSTHVMSTHVIPYTSGSIHQLNTGGAISGSIITESAGGVSSIMLIKLYRDDNTYTGNVITYQFDIHFEKDTLGSRDLYSK